LSTHDHFFLGDAHKKNERRTWMVIGLCTFMMVAEVVGGLLFGSIALVADGLHMSTHASALLLAALAYRYAGAMRTTPAIWARSYLSRHSNRANPDIISPCSGDSASYRRNRTSATSVTSYPCRSDAGDGENAPEADMLKQGVERGWALHRCPAWNWPQCAERGHANSTGP
jgi:hypothetical protein